MEPIYIDIHVHTSDNPDKLNTSYDINTLFSKITSYGQNAMCLLSLTDHNTINKKAYIDALELKNPKIKLLLGAEYIFIIMWRLPLIIVIYCSSLI